MLEKLTFLEGDEEVFCCFIADYRQVILVFSEEF
jgi:hypothetical protein